MLADVLELAGNLRIYSRHAAHMQQSYQEIIRHFLVRRLIEIQKDRCKLNIVDTPRPVAMDQK